MTQDNFYETVYVKGHRRRWEADLDWTAGPASVRAESTHVSDDRQAQGIGDQDLPERAGALVVRVGNVGAHGRRQAAADSRV